MGKKRNRKAIVITALIMLAGILLVLTGLFGGWFIGLFYKDFDFKNIKTEDLGKDIKTDIKVYYDPMEIPGKALQMFGDFEGDAAFILLDFAGVGEKGERLYFSKYYHHNPGQAQSLG